MLTSQFKATQLKKVFSPAQLLPLNAFGQYNLSRQLNWYFFGWYSLVRLLILPPMGLTKLKTRVSLLIPLLTSTIPRAKACLLIPLLTLTGPKTKVLVTIAAKVMAAKVTK